MTDYERMIAQENMARAAEAEEITMTALETINDIRKNLTTESSKLANVTIDPKSALVDSSELKRKMNEAEAMIDEARRILFALTRGLI